MNQLMNISRRNLISGASAAALTTVAPGLKAAFGAVPNGEMLVVIFQRGACDWMQMLAPSGDANYIAARPTIKVPTTGTNAGLGVGTLNGVDFYLSKSAPELRTLYTSGKLAFVHAAGLKTADRSHFLCQNLMEEGIQDGDTRQSTGWMARHVTSSMGGLPPTATIGIGSATPNSLIGNIPTVAINNVTNFTISGSTSMPAVIRQLNAGTSAFNKSATETLDTVDLIKSKLAGISTANTSGYTSGPLSQALQTLGYLIKMNVGLSVAVVDHGGWDTHNNLTAEFASRTTEFSKSISAFWTDMANYRGRLTVVTMTEFGRRLQENASQGTDHGSGGGMLVLGGGVNGGKIYGSWPGLAAAQLDQGDLKVTTDYRQVLAEILVKRHGETSLGSVFPTLQYAPLGIMSPST
jgi:uncharacterized protein (DUF1501 family)